jgi:hypothetical protein
VRGGSRARAALVAVLAVLMIVGLAPGASAHPRSERALAHLNSELWRALLSTPTTFDDPASPFQTPVCLHIDHVVAPFSGNPDVTSFRCDVPRGTPVLVAGWTLEASAVEERTAPPPQDASAAGLRRRALSQLPARPTVLLDGRRVRLTKVVAPLATVDLPQPNLLGAPDASTSYVAVGWVALVVPRHRNSTVTITPAPTADVPHPTTVTTVLHVTRRHHRG